MFIFIKLKELIVEEKTLKKYKKFFWSALMFKYHKKGCKEDSLTFYHILGGF